MIEIIKTTYNGWSNCYKITNGQIEIIALADVGPRIISCKFCGEENLFFEFPEQAGLTVGDKWRIFGGHRLWHSPEKGDRTYYPDNLPVEVSITGDKLLLIQREEETTKVQKIIEIGMDEKTGMISVNHRIKNCGYWDIKLSAWAISAMAPGGLSILKQGLRNSGDLYTPDLRINVWPLTSLQDSRVKWGNEFITLKQNPLLQEKFKIGVSSDAGWIAYANKGVLFVKYHSCDKLLEYPDFGSTTELYTDADFSEIETLSPLKEIAPGEEITHTEKWQLIRISQNQEELMDESVLNSYIIPLLLE